MTGEIHAGEMIETIILSRKSGAYGEYTGSFGDTRTCVVLGHTFFVTQYAEVHMPYWGVHHPASGVTVQCQDRWDLASVTLEQFGLEPENDE